MNSQRYIAAVAAAVARELHQTGTAYRCRCGACRHRVVASARRIGIQPEVLVAALPPERKPKKEARPKRRALTASIGTSAVVSRGRRRAHGAEALFMLGRVRDSRRAG